MIFFRNFGEGFRSILTLKAKTFCFDRYRAIDHPSSLDLLTILMVYHCAISLKELFECWLISDLDQEYS
jgi:hypothetical protein